MTFFESNKKSPRVKFFSALVYNVELNNATIDEWRMIAKTRNVGGHENMPWSKTSASISKPISTPVSRPSPRPVPRRGVRFLSFLTRRLRSHLDEPLPVDMDEFEKLGMKKKYLVSMVWLLISQIS